MNEKRQHRNWKNTGKNSLGKTHRNERMQGRIQNQGTRLRHADRAQTDREETQNDLTKDKGNTEAK